MTPHSLPLNVYHVNIITVQRQTLANFKKRHRLSCHAVGSIASGPVRRSTLPAGTDTQSAVDVFVKILAGAGHPVGGEMGRCSGESAAVTDSSVGQSEAAIRPQWRLCL